jgi:hypothetical protein
MKSAFYSKKFVRASKYTDHAKRERIYFALLGIILWLDQEKRMNWKRHLMKRNTG